MSRDVSRLTSTVKPESRRNVTHKFCKGKEFTWNVLDAKSVE